MTTAEEVQADLIPIYIMGKRYLVPDTLTIMKAMEYAGYQFIRGCGCRGGICGACSTVFRKEGDYKIYTGLACQTVVEPNMYLTQLPFYPALRQSYDYAAADPQAETIHALYPEIFRCVACNACTKVCPMDVQVMDYVSAIKQGDLKKATELSFDCIQCGLCASRCMGEMPQYHLGQVARRTPDFEAAPPRADPRPRAVPRPRADPTPLPSRTPTTTCPSDELGGPHHPSGPPPTPSLAKSPMRRKYSGPPTQNTSL